MDPTTMMWVGIAAVALSLAGFVFLLVDRPVVRTRTLTNLRRGETTVATTTVPAARAGLGSRVAGALPPRTVGFWNRLIQRAGRPAGWTVEKLITTKLALGLVGVAISLLLLFGSRGPLVVLVALVLPVLLFFLPELLLWNTGIKRREAMALALPDMLDQMSIAVEAGLGFDAAMVRVARNSRGPLAEEFLRALQDIQVGQSRRIAYESLAERCAVPSLKRFVRSLVQAETYGLAMATVLHSQADELRVERRQNAETRAMRIPVKVLFPLVMCIFPALFIVLLGPAGIRIMQVFAEMGGG